MHESVKNYVSRMARVHELGRGSVLDVGSFDVNGNVRDIFKGARYVGIDSRPGPNVDRVVDAHDLVATFGPESFDTVVCCEMLEHDLNFLETISNIYHVLKPGGYLIITTPTFGFPLHRFPKDYWRFGEDAFREVFFVGFEILNLVHLDDALIPAKNVTIAAIGRKL